MDFGCVKADLSMEAMTHSNKQARASENDLRTSTGDGWESRPKMRSESAFISWFTETPGPILYKMLATNARIRPKT